MPKAPKTRSPSKTVALTYLNTVLPTYAPGATGSKSNRILEPDWVDIQKALDVLGRSDATDASSSHPAPIMPPEPKIEHCVRCHREYDINSHGREARCQIPHVFGEDGQLWGPDIRRYEPECCDDGGYVLEEDAGNGDYKLKGNAKRPCITHKHTTDPEKVEYNDCNVVECSPGPDGKCELEWLKMKDMFDTPAFTCNVYC
ncbi:hypothetical protein PENSPDRAFT_690000 [Peniophora sp. CONT]|nr:hypothetical protein PENSPDRAFT_690000 [Peniophora sp. CONT]